LRAFLADRGIGAAVYYPLSLHLQPCFEELGYEEGDFPVAEQASREVLALPVFPELVESEQEEVVHAFEEFYAN
jgi:dTDP-4-amino-4,6-dideoxygalactose transaminase